MKRISFDPPIGAPARAAARAASALNKALAVLETLDSVVVERCTEQSCEVCAQELELAA